MGETLIEMQARQMIQERLSRASEPRLPRKGRRRRSRGQDRVDTPRLQ